ncbi:hypothetical protein CDL12_17575 [Handroanthus impetiginosus]|uniref:Thionin-like protein 2 n=1 Tax=Handroanthus impetiginosus TaxID=429701 RepID=A0A2G9GXB6_9LAMI|nr:hypothetical protein CDL12_17575 [Handroanthus impetiginosus]
MELRKLGALVLVVVLAVGILSEKSSASFKDCYTKCFVFCMIEPSQTLCSCTTHCLKDCIFQEIQNDLHEQDSDNLGFCKLGCAFSMCSNLSSKRTPNGDKVDGCVGSCSNKCIKSYSSP